MIAFWLSRFRGWIIGFGAVVAFVVAAYLRGRRSGIEKMESEQAQRRIEAMRQRKDIEDEVADLGPADLDVHYRKWLRDGG